MLDANLKKASNREPFAGQTRDTEDPILEFLRFCVRFRLVLFITSIFGLVIALYLHITSPSLYEAKAILSDNDPSLPYSVLGGTQLPGSFSILSALGDRPSSVTVAHLKSLQGAKTFVESEKLLEEPFITEKLPSSTVAPMEDIAARYLAEKLISVDRDNKTGLIEVKFAWPDRIQSAQLLQKYIDHVDDIIKSNFLSSSATAVDFLESSLSKRQNEEFSAALIYQYQRAIQPLVFKDAPGRFALRTIDPPLVPLHSNKPHILVTILAGVIGGAFLGIMTALIITMISVLRRNLYSHG